MTTKFFVAALVVAVVISWGMAPTLADPLTDAISQVQGLLTKAEGQVDSQEAKAYLKEAELLLAEGVFIAKAEQIQVLLEKATAQADFDTQVLLSESRMLLSEVKAQQEQVAASPLERQTIPEDEFLTYP
jgi:hypothetical protein